MRECQERPHTARYPPPAHLKSYGRCAHNKVCCAWCLVRLTGERGAAARGSGAGARGHDTLTPRGARGQCCCTTPSLSRSGVSKVKRAKAQGLPLGLPQRWLNRPMRHAPRHYRPRASVCRSSCYLYPIAHPTRTRAHGSYLPDAFASSAGGAVRSPTAPPPLARGPPRLSAAPPASPRSAASPPSSPQR